MDLPILRLAEVYLNYAEAVARGGGGSANTALGLINQLRTRAGAPQATAAEMNTQFVMDERSRELYWEGTRRTDLIRDGKFTTADYLWPFKAGAALGQSTGNHRNIFPSQKMFFLLILTFNKIQIINYEINYKIQ